MQHNSLYPLHIRILGNWPNQDSNLPLLHVRKFYYAPLCFLLLPPDTESIWFQRPPLSLSTLLHPNPHQEQDQFPHFAQKLLHLFYSRRLQIPISQCTHWERILQWQLNHPLSIYHNHPIISPVWIWRSSWLLAKIMRLPKLYLQLSFWSHSHILSRLFPFSTWKCSRYSQLKVSKANLVFSQSTPL